MDTAMSMMGRRRRGLPTAVELSAREREVLALALTGMTASAMAEALFVTEATIRSHLARIYAKVGVHNRVELVLAFEDPAAGPMPSRPHETSSSEQRSPPPRPWYARVRLAAASIVILSAILALGLILLPPRSISTPLSTIAAALGRGDVAQLRLIGDTLTVTTKDGQVLQSRPVTGAQFAGLDRSRVTGGTYASGAPGEPLTIVGMFATAVAPVVVLVLLLVVALR
ncbi:MAG: helix-turn-helix domain-containing protein, partial [Candidatus Limnocylindrales bacterium]